MYSWIWLLRRPSAGSLIGITILPPSHTTVEMRAEYSVRICVVVEVQQLGEAEHVAVEVHPVVELALLDVADDVVDGAQPDVRPDRRVRQVLGAIARFEHVAAVAGPVDERVHGVAVRRDLRQLELAVIVDLGPRFAHGPRAALDCGGVRGARVVDEPREIVDTVAVAAHVFGDGGVGRQRAAHDEANVALLEHVARLRPVRPSRDRRRRCSGSRTRR